MKIMLENLFVERDKIESKLGKDAPIEKKLRQILNSKTCKDFGWKIASISSLAIEDNKKIDCLHIGKFGMWSVWKKPIFTGLLANQIVRGNLTYDTEIIVEGGGVSTAYCLNELAEKTNKNVVFITSRFYPETLLKKLVSDKVQLILAPENKALSIEEEFYTHLVNHCKLERKKRRKICSLWHVKWSQYIGEIYADQLIEKHRHYFETLDYFIITVGSGSTLAIAAKIKQSFNHIKIIVAEPQESPLIAQAKGINLPKANQSKPDISLDYFVDADKRISHLTFGPHYEKLNPKIKQDNVNTVDDIRTYSTFDWQEASMSMRKQNMGVGNSSAACLAIANKLITEEPNAKILTVIFEPLRSYSLTKIGKWNC